MKCPYEHQNFARRPVYPDLRAVLNGRGELLGWQCPLCHAQLWLTGLDLRLLGVLTAAKGAPLTTRQVLRAALMEGAGQDAMRRVRDALWHLVECDMATELDRQGWCRPRRWVLQTAGMQTAGMQTAGCCARLENGCAGPEGGNEGEG